MANSNHNGFLEDLAHRPDSIAGAEVVSMEKLARGNFGLIPIFNVEKKTRLADGTEKVDRYTYEYFSWRYGPESGAKGAVLVRSGDKIVGFVALSGEKFATGKEELDSVGGFADLNVNGVNTMLKRIETEVKEELGQDDIRVANVYELGDLATDAGMTNNRPQVFVAEISADDAAKIKSHPQNPDVFELPHGAQVRDISELPNFLRHSDPYFAVSVLRAALAGIIPIEYLTGNVSSEAQR